VFIEVFRALASRQRMFGEVQLAERVGFETAVRIRRSSCVGSQQTHRKVGVHARNDSRRNLKDRQSDHACCLLPAAKWELFRFSNASTQAKTAVPQEEPGCYRCERFRANGRMYEVLMTAGDGRPRRGIAHGMWPEYKCRPPHLWL
jgi:hypothetical protein